MELFFCPEIRNFDGAKVKGAQLMIYEGVLMGVLLCKFV
jgi:hypothetical protein